MVEVSAGADAFREEVLRAARTFKASWTGLAKVLTRVRDEALWEGWGFPSFEAYCGKELRIRKATALKLTRSWSFLDRHERGWQRGRVRRRGRPRRSRWSRSSPRPRSVGPLGAEEYRSIRDSIWDQERPVAAVRRELSDRFPRPGPGARTGGGAPRVSSHARRAASPRSSGCAAGCRRRCGPRRTTSRRRWSPWRSSGAADAERLCGRPPVPVRAVLLQISCPRSSARRRPGTYIGQGPRFRGSVGGGAGIGVCAGVVWIVGQGQCPGGQRG